LLQSGFQNKKDWQCHTFVVYCRLETNFIIYLKGIMMDLSNMSLVELRNLQEQIKQETKKREQQDLTKAREQILAIAQSVGIPLKDLIDGAVRAKTGRVAVRYRNPDEATQQWTGRGRQPKWIKEWLEAGKSLDLLRV
jgi:DNA-binding protein H-NS